MADQEASGSQFSGDDEPTRGAILPEVIDRHVRAALAERVRSMIPARVTRYDANKGQVDCKPLIGDFHRDETGQLLVASVPVIPSVPVAFLSAGGFVFTVPIQAGDGGTLGMLLFADRSMDRWLSGSGQEVVDPEVYTRSALTDAVFVPGLFTFGAPMAAPPTDHAFAGAAGGVGIHFRSNKITIGDESGSKALGLDGDEVDCGELEILGGIGNAFAGLQYTDPFGTVTTINATGTPLPLKGKLSASATQGYGK